MQRKDTISCEMHDYLEVACLYRYELTVTLIDGAVIRGRARTTRTTKGVEMLLLDTDSGERGIGMHELAEITVLTPDARFSKLRF